MQHTLLQLLIKSLDGMSMLYTKQCSLFWVFEPTLKMKAAAIAALDRPAEDQDRPVMHTSVPTAWLPAVRLSHRQILSMVKPAHSLLQFMFSSCEHPGTAPIFLRRMVISLSLNYLLWHQKTNMESNPHVGHPNVIYMLIVIFPLSCLVLS